MSTVASLIGWLAAGGALLVAFAGERMHRRRMELVARACHEVRGPLCAARLGVSTLGRGPLTPAAGRLVALDVELRRAGLALEDLDAARAGRRVRDRLESVDIGELLLDSAAAWRPVAQARGSELRVVEPREQHVVRGDRVRLAQACGNLLANAIEHGKGPVELTVRCAGPNVRIECSDHGSGLPAAVEEITRRARSGRGKRGRGLAITAEIARRHGGILASAPSQYGARLALELPASGERHGIL